jgi:hypothetical protein
MRLQFPYPGQMAVTLRQRPRVPKASVKVEGGGGFAQRIVKTYRVDASGKPVNESLEDEMNECTPGPW